MFYTIEIGTLAEWFGVFLTSITLVITIIIALLIPKIKSTRNEIKSFIRKVNESKISLIEVEILKSERNLHEFIYNKMLTTFLNIKLIEDSINNLKYLNNKKINKFINVNINSIFELKKILENSFKDLNELEKNILDIVGHLYEIEDNDNLDWIEEENKRYEIKQKVYEDFFSIRIEKINNILDNILKKWN
ncbi:unknown transmembrane protein [Mesoplasma florum L1]|uniref:Uncharacterized protein n=1 Tax=Mesoplasma florum (strain ATCC 33453 / NBRC 100688 / NCTC 11704 / L1) TaxID=265311 RepID=Q6F0Z8_MESFL|nr:hypothetical protein [Mesoplasma florum]AAT75825.1 unknown transmembrane protein [Mesoplasma florum L1]